MLQVVINHGTGTRSDFKAHMKLNEFVSYSGINLLKNFDLLLFMLL